MNFLYARRDLISHLKIVHGHELGIWTSYILCWANLFLYLDGISDTKFQFIFFSLKDIWNFLLTHKCSLTWRHVKKTGKAWYGAKSPPFRPTSVSYQLWPCLVILKFLSLIFLMYKMGMVTYSHRQIYRLSMMAKLDNVLNQFVDLRCKEVCLLTHHGQQTHKDLKDRFPRSKW